MVRMHDIIPRGGSGPLPTSKRLAPQLATLAIALIVGIIGLELALRLLGAGPLHVNPDQKSLWAHDSRLGWINHPGHVGTFDNGFFRVQVEINSKGLRGAEVGYQKPQGLKRILVVGDSFAWGFGVEQDEIFSTRLEAALPDTEVINAGVSGYSTDQALLWLQQEGKRYSPDVVIYLLSGNDDIMNSMQLAYWVYYKPSFQLDRLGDLVLQGVPVPEASFENRARHFLRSRSAIAKAVEVALQGHEASFVYLADSIPDPKNPHRLTVALVDAMRNEARSVGASFLVVANAQFWFSPNGSYERLLVELRRAGGDVIDLIDVESHPGWDADAMQIPGDGHWNGVGHAFVSGLVADRLAAQGLDQPSAARGWSNAKPAASK
jgi:hypothetical protein